MKYIIELGTDWKQLHPCVKLQVQSYVNYRTTKNCLAITARSADALRFDTPKEANKFLKSHTVKLGIASINSSKEVLGFPIYEPKVTKIRF